MNTISFINDYLKELKKEYLTKEYNIINNSHKQIFTHKENNSFLSLKDILTKKYFIEDSLKQNEINSINEIQKNKFIVFNTSTLSPILNLRENINDIEDFENQSINQYKEYNKYFNHINKTNKDKNLKYKNIRTFELTKKFNLHNHKLDFLENKEDIISYIETLMLSRNKFNIGRIELSIDYDYFTEIQTYFKDKKIKIRVNNKYIFLTLSKKTFNKKSFYYIKESRKGNGNFIYFKTIEKQDANDKEHLTKYLFKYMLKTFSKNQETEFIELKPHDNVSNEVLLFSKLKFKQKIFSENFFTDKINKDYLEKLNNKFFTYFKQKSINKITPLDYLKKEDLEFLEENKNKMFFGLSKMLEENKFYFSKGQDIISQEYLKIKSLVRINIDDYNDKKRKYFLSLIHSHYSNPMQLNEAQCNETLSNEIQKEIKQREKNINFMKVYYEVIGIDREFKTIETEYKEEKINDVEEKLIINLTKEIFKYINSKYNFQNTEDEIYYYNDEINEFILIHSFKSNYKFEKFNTDIELYEDLLNNKSFNNDYDRLDMYVKLINTLNEFWQIEEILTTDIINEEYEKEKEEKRNYKNSLLTYIIEELETDNEINEDILNYYQSLIIEEKEDFINKNDKHIKKICLSI